MTTNNMQTLDRTIDRKTGTTKPRNILVVDDEPFVCDAVRMMLSFDGHGVTTVSSAREGLTKLATGDFDLVITDFAMPVMKGNELAAAVKGRHPGIPVIMITAYAEILDPARDSLDGVDAVLSKPFMLEDLREAVHKAFVK